LSYKNKTVSNEEGVIVSEITKKEKTNSFVFKNNDNEKFIIYTNKHNNYFYGDKVSISGKIQIPESFENENGIIFDYPKFLLKDGITHTSFYPTIELIEKAHQRDLRWHIFTFKNILVTQSNKIFSSQTSKIVLGVILGIKDSINIDLQDAFRKTGLIHILVLSGFNLTIIAYFVFILLSRFHRNVRYFLSLFFILIFVIMVGANATIVRAGIMISLFIFSKLLRRNNSSLNALLLAGSIMMFVNPMILLYDPSFQLSFVATLGLISFYKILESKLHFIPEKFSLKEIVISNISVQLTIIPLLIYLMGEFSVIALVPNIIVLPIIPIFMLTAFLAIVISFLFPNISLLLVFATEFLSKVIVFTVEFFGNFNFSIIKTGTISIRFLLVIYLVYIFFIVFLNMKNKVILKQKYNYLQS
jgi:competence protein ComEC